METIALASPTAFQLSRTALKFGVVGVSVACAGATLSFVVAGVEVESEERWQAIASTDVCRRWWRHMREIMPSNPDDSPVSRELREVFHVEGREPA